MAILMKSWKRHRRIMSVFIVALLLCWSPLSTLQGQTVLNPGFEQWDISPVNMQTGELHTHCTDWIRACAPTTTPDFFHQLCTRPCLPLGKASVPENERGHQTAKSGDGYAGILTIKYPSDDYREYMRGTITNLVIGTTYELSFWVCLGEVSDRYFNGLQACVTTLDWLADPRQPTWETLLPPEYVAQISLDPGHMVGSVDNWREIKGNFVATDTEEFIYVGYFGDLNNAQSNPSPQYVCMTQPASGEWTHYYVDAFSIQEAPVAPYDCCDDENEQANLLSASIVQDGNCCAYLVLQDNSPFDSPCSVRGVRIKRGESWQIPPAIPMIYTPPPGTIPGHIVNPVFMNNVSTPQEFLSQTWSYNAGQTLQKGTPVTVGRICVCCGQANNTPLIIEFIGADGYTVLCRKTVEIDCDPV